MGQAANSAPAGTFPAHLALTGSQVIFGLFPVFGLVVFQPGGLTPFGLAAWRLTAGAAILWPLALAIDRRRALPVRRDLGRLILAGWLGVAFNQILFLQGLSRSTPVNAALMTCLIPVFTFGLAAAAKLERFSGRRLAGILIALAGTLALLVEGLSGLGLYGAANLLMVANAFLYSLFLLVSKPLLARYSPLGITAWCYVFSLPFAVWFAWGQPLVPGPGQVAVWWGILYTIGFPTVLAYLLNVFALSRLPASTTATYVYAQPFITGLASWLVFRELPTARMLVAAPALFLGIWLVSRPAGGVLASAAGSPSP